MSDTPLWPQVVIPAATLVGGFGLGRVSKRLDRRQGQREVEAARSPHFVLNHETGTNYRLTNDGNATADLVEVDPGDYLLTRNLPDKITLRPEESCTITIFRTNQVPDPTQLYVTWKGCSEPQVLPVPRPRD